MNITVICVGKIKEKFYTDAVAEYAKRLKRFCDFKVTELPDESIPDNASAKEIEAVKNKEGERILSGISPRSRVIALCIEGKQMTSEGFADFMKDSFMTTNNITFVIGGSLGLSDAVKNRSDLSLSFGRMTFPHRLMRVILTEQIYRAFMINTGSKYHK